MTFTPRERFIYHVTVIMTLHLTQKKAKPVCLGFKNCSCERMSELIALFLKNRCRKLTKDDVEKIYQDIEEETLLSAPVFDMAKKSKETKEDWK